MFHCLPYVIETKQKRRNIFHLIQVTIGGGGGQDGKWSHFPPGFFDAFPKSVGKPSKTLNPHSHGLDEISTVFVIPETSVILT